MTINFKSPIHQEGHTKRYVVQASFAGMSICLNLTWKNTVKIKTRHSLKTLPFLQKYAHKNARQNKLCYNCTCYLEKLGYPTSIKYQ